MKALRQAIQHSEQGSHGGFPDQIDSPVILSRCFRYKKDGGRLHDPKASSSTHPDPNERGDGCGDDEVEAGMRHVIIRFFFASRTDRQMA